MAAAEYNTMSTAQGSGCSWDLRWKNGTCQWGHVYQEFKRACQRGNLVTARWFCRAYDITANDVKDRDPVQMSNGPDVLLLASAKGHLAMTKWLVEEFFAGEQEYLGHSMRWALVQACASGQLIMAMWLADKLKFNRDDPQLPVHCLVNDACARGHLRVVQWLHRTYAPTLDEIVEPQLGALWTAIGGGHAAMVRWMCEAFNVQQEDVLLDGRCSLLAEACQQGQLLIVAWLCVYFQLTKHEVWNGYGAQFCAACPAGRRRVARWLQAEFGLDVWRPGNPCGRCWMSVEQRT